MLTLSSVYLDWPRQPPLMPAEQENGPGPLMAGQKNGPGPLMAETKKWTGSTYGRTKKWTRSTYGRTKNRLGPLMVAKTRPGLNLATKK
jgi:hypothetical protein